MHDQEPCFVNMLNTYRDSMIVEKKVYPCLSHLDCNGLNEFVTTLEGTTAFEFYHLLQKSARKPIICHSELNSNDIAEFKDNNFIECYYWWHGMVARDWFRHYEHHGDLLVTNKSNASRRFLLYARASNGTRLYRKKIIEFFKANFGWEHKEINSDASAEISIEDANNYAIHVVAETLFDYEKIYLTEKVFKPMVMSQPFILFSAPGSLQYLRDYGFKTFDSIWSEEYDLIKDHQLRKDAVLKLIKDLSKLTPGDFNDMYIKALPIISHNRDRFFSVQFQRDLMSEMTNNIEAAISEQQAYYDQRPGDPWCYYMDKIAKERKLPSNWIKWLRESLAADGNLIKTINSYPRLRSLI